MTETDIQRELTRPGRMFYYRKFLVVPNASWGVGLHECDLLALTASGEAHEIEIKVSVGDLKRDSEKRHHHESKRIKCLWFAAPACMREALLEHVPERAGIIIVHDQSRGYSGVLEIVRKPQRRADARAFTFEERYDLARLGTIRYWSRLHA
jgi:hypothetical protein